jgi:hypothetical protein
MTKAKKTKMKNIGFLRFKTSAQPFKATSRTEAYLEETSSKKGFKRLPSKDHQKISGGPCL